MPHEAGAVRVSVDVGLAPDVAFAALVDELATVLRRRGVRFDPRTDGTVIANDTVVGRVAVWEAGTRAVLQWYPATWQPERVTELEIRVDDIAGGARLAIEQRGWGAVIGDAAELAGWFAAEVAGPLLQAMTPVALGDWLTDRLARRPSGPQSRATYRDPLFHYPNFRVILSELALTPADYLLEVACGGGAFLKLALASGCRAAGVDHSIDMVEVARDANRDALAEGRLEIVEADAGTLPFADDQFTCAAMTGVLGFLADPVAALKEIRRVLAPGGRAVILGTDPENRGTPAAPEPMASRLRFYEEQDLENLGRAAGFASVRAFRRDLEQYAREAGVPEGALPLFAGPGARFLLVHKT